MEKTTATLHNKSMNVKKRARGIIIILILTFISPLLLHYAGVVTRSSSFGTPSLQMRANESLKDGRKYPMLQLDWAKMRQRQFQHIFTFISAYHDNRINAAGRPAIVVLTYVNATVSAPPELRCLYLYSNGSRQCLQNQVAKVENVDCFAKPYAFKAAIFKFVLCPLDNLKEVPVTLQLSSSVNCTKVSLSDPINVRPDSVTRKRPKQSKIGVCVHSSLREKGRNVLQKIQNFISMSRFLGAGFVTMYAVPTQVSSEVITSLTTSYFDVVNLVEWRAPRLPLQTHG